MATFMGLRYRDTGEQTGLHRTPGQRLGCQSDTVGPALQPEFA
jgi:hypothetical protein